MAKRLSKEEKSKEVVVHLVNKMFEFANLQVTYDDIAQRKDKWYDDWTMNDKQYSEWISYGENYLSKKLKLNKKRSQSEMGMFSLNFGLTVDNTNFERSQKINIILGK
jgi:hypothetical protein